MKRQDQVRVLLPITRPSRNTARQGRMAYVYTNRKRGVFCREKGGVRYVRKETI
jgi:hypothetical protein